MLKWLIEPFVEIYNSLRSNKSEGILWIWLIVCWTIITVIYFWGNDDLQLNLVGDAMWWIFGTLISTIVLIFVIESYNLQKKELEETRKVLEWQEGAMNEQRFQDNFFRLIELFNSHRRRTAYKRIYESTLERFSFEDIVPKLLDWIGEAILGSSTFPWSDFTRVNDAQDTWKSNNKDHMVDTYRHMMTRPDWKTTQSLVLQYMQFISQMHRLVEASQLNQERKSDFKQILESMLSWEEKNLISIHMQSGLSPIIIK